jgi:cytochrome c peroxidase
MKVILVILLLLCSTVVMISSFQKKKDAILFEVPKGFPAIVYNLKANPVTTAGFELGRSLFYDGRLSKDGSFSCGSCHQQFAAFATYDHDFSHGINNQFTNRNAPGLFNLAWQKNFHWDGGINNLEVQPLAPITAHNEMAEDLAAIVKKLNEDIACKQQFKAAFGTQKITGQLILKALSQFLVMLVSANSKYDKVQRGEAVFSNYEAEGHKIFMAKCNSCHTAPLFTDVSYRNSGLPVNNTINDFGRMAITTKKSDSLKFKVPSLRNVALTFPYGHDGRFFSITQVLDHYSDGVQQSATLDSSLQHKIALTQNDKIYLQTFLRTLTDTTFTKNKKFAPPHQMQYVH